MYQQVRFCANLLWSDLEFFYNETRVVLRRVNGLREKTKAAHSELGL
jgi:hypothetical protein